VPWFGASAVVRGSSPADVRSATQGWPHAVRLRGSVAAPRLRAQQGCRAAGQQGCRAAGQQGCMWLARARATTAPPRAHAVGLLSSVRRCRMRPSAAAPGSRTRLRLVPSSPSRSEGRLRAARSIVPPHRQRSACMRRPESTSSGRSSDSLPIMEPCPSAAAGLIICG